jgi:two-component system cell cycle sensor histidine kinase/response regulator CckA
MENVPGGFVLWDVIGPKRLLAAVKFEFNNLLIPIMGYSEFLLERISKDSGYYEEIEEIHKAGIRAKEIVKQILIFSRKERKFY